MAMRRASVQTALSRSKRHMRAAYRIFIRTLEASSPRILPLHLTFFDQSFLADIGIAVFDLFFLVGIGILGIGILGLGGLVGGANSAGKKSLVVPSVVS